MTDLGSTNADVQELLALAEDEARRRGDSVWGSGEMLLALLDLPQSNAAAALRHLGLSKTVASEWLSENRPPKPGELVRSHEVGYHLARAERIAAAHGDNDLTLDHVLLAMLWERDSPASFAVAAQGVTYEDCYRALFGKSPPPELTPPPYVEPNYGEPVRIPVADLQIVLAHLSAVLPRGHQYAFNLEGDNDEIAIIWADAREDLPALVQQALNQAPRS